MTVAPSRPSERATEATKRKPGRPRDQRVSSAITGAALRQLAEVGYANVSMESIATEAGVARATIYRRYRDKADLITAAIAADGAHMAPGADSDPRDGLVHFLNEFDERFAESCLEVVGTLIGSHGDPAGLSLHRQRVITPRLGSVRTFLERAQHQGLIGAGADLELAIQMLTGSVLARRIAGMEASPGWAERAVDTLFAGMGGRADSVRHGP